MTFAMYQIRARLENIRNSGTYNTQLNVGFGSVGEISIVDDAASQSFLPGGLRKVTWLIAEDGFSDLLNISI